MQKWRASLDLRQIRITAGEQSANRTCFSCVCCNCHTGSDIRRVRIYIQQRNISDKYPHRRIPTPSGINWDLFNPYIPYPKPIHIETHRLPFKTFRKILFQDNCNCIRRKDERVLRSNFAFSTFPTLSRPPTRRLPPLMASQNIFQWKHSKLKDDLGKRKGETIKFLMLISFLSPISPLLPSQSQPQIQTMIHRRLSRWNGVE